MKNITEFAWCPYSCLVIVEELPNPNAQRGWENLLSICPQQGVYAHGTSKQTSGRVVLTSIMIKIIDNHTAS